MPNTERQITRPRIARAAGPARALVVCALTLFAVFVRAERTVDRLQTEARGMHLLWSNGRPEEAGLLALPFMHGGQAMVQWADVEPRPGKYDFSALDKRIAQVTAKGSWCTVQINGNEKPAWLFDQVPHITEKLHHQVRDAKGTLMFWHPRFEEAYLSMLRAAAAHLRENPHRSRLLGIRLNFNAIGTEQHAVSQKYRDPSGWNYPKGCKRDGLPVFNDKVRDAYIASVVGAYKKEFSEWMLVFVRNNVDGELLQKLDADFRAGRLALFHTSSEAEPRTSGTERRYGLFYDYARSGGTVAYAEPWASAWGEHGGKIDARWCSPCQWSYWTLLFNMHCGVSFIGDYSINYVFAMGAKHPRRMAQTKNPKQQAREFMTAYEWADRYAGRHNRPEESPGAWVAFRENREIKAKNGPGGPSVWKLNRFTGDYDFLMARIDNDGSAGVGPVGPVDERYGAFARLYPPGKYARLKIDAALLASLARGKAATVRVIYLDDNAAAANAATVSFNMRDGEKPLGKLTHAGSGRWRAADFELTATDLAPAAPDWQIGVTAGDQPLTLHMVEIIRRP